MARGGILTLPKTRLAQDMSRGRRGYNGLRLVDCSLSGAQASGGGGHALTRSSSGILLFDDFNTALSGNWTSDQGTWSTSGGNLTNTSAGNYDRLRNTSVTVAAAMYEARLKSTASGIYCGVRLLCTSGNIDITQMAVGNNSDNRLIKNKDTGNLTGSTNLGMNTTSFHALKVLYVPTSKFVIWFDHVAKLGTIASPFDVSAGSPPTAANNPGVFAYGGAALYDWVLVSADYKVTVTGLSGTQAFRIFDGSHTVIGSSSTQSSGSATIDITTLVDGLITGTVEVYDSTSWGTLLATYPSVGTATDICGGDSYAFT